MGTHGVEVAQDAHRPILVRVLNIGQDALDHLLGLAVGVGGLAQGGGLLDGDLGGIAVDRGRGGEDNDFDTVLLHGLAEVEGGDQIVVVVGCRNGHRLAHGLQTREVDDTLDIGVLGKNLVQSLGVAEVGFIELGALTRDGLDAVQDDLLAVAEIVHDDGCLACLDQLDDGMGADKAGSAGDEDGHGGRFLSVIGFCEMQNAKCKIKERGSRDLFSSVKMLYWRNIFSCNDSLRNTSKVSFA